MSGNFGFASTLLDTLRKHGNTCPVMLSSSIQASLTGREGARLPLPEPLRQVVPSELQLRSGHILPQHRKRPPHPGQRPIRGAGAALHRRPRGRDDRRPHRQGAPVRVRRPGRGPGQRGALLPLPRDAPREARGDSGAAALVPRPAGHTHDAGDSRRLFRQEALLHIPELPAQGESRIPIEDERRPARLVHGDPQDRVLRPVQRQHFQTWNYERPALAQLQVGAVHRGQRQGPDTAEEDRLGRGAQLRGERGQD